MTVIEFTSKEEKSKSETQAEVIEELERLLDEARQGVIVGVAFATVVNDGSTGSGWCGWGQKDMSFGISLLNYRYHKSAWES